MVLDTDEIKLLNEKKQPEKAKPIKDLGNRLESLKPPHELSSIEKDRIFSDVVSIVGHPQVAALQATEVRVED